MSVFRVSDMYRVVSSITFTHFYPFSGLSGINIMDSQAREDVTLSVLTTIGNLMFQEMCTLECLRRVRCDPDHSSMNVNWYQGL